MFDCDSLQTPAFVYDWDGIAAALGRLAEFRKASKRQLLYSIKAVPLVALLERIRPSVDGFSVSSIFEARLAREVLGPGPVIQLTTPGLTESNSGSIAALCDQISFNSLSQWQAFSKRTKDKSQCGLRLNPGLVTGLDPRYDPCRPHSKLGVALEELCACWHERPRMLDQLSGLHVHTSFNAASLNGLRQLVELLELRLDTLLSALEWVNLGGGYLLEDTQACAELIVIADRLQTRYGLRVLIEPGTAVVGAAGYLVAQVIDLFRSDGRQVAVLDTTVSHLPRVFEYQLTPTVKEARPDGNYEYLLAGASCLAGDLFGVHRFERALQPGSFVTFSGVGAYMLVKASRFNGINLPAVYLCSAEGGLELIKDYDYDDYRCTWGR